MEFTPPSRQTCMHSPRSIPWRTVLLGTLLFASLAICLEVLDLDRAIASRWAFDASHSQFRARNAFWSNGLLHAGGRGFVWAVGVAAISCAALGYLAPRRFPLLRAEAYRLTGAVLGVGLTIAFVGTVKHYSNVDCPWDLIDFGGTNPFAGLIAHRPSGLPPARCFPAAHAASGYALIAFYFAFHESHPRLGRCMLALAMMSGAAFGIAQQARGAHFLSHDLCSAYLAWLIGLASQCCWRGFRAARLPPVSAQLETRSCSGR